MPQDLRYYLSKGARGEIERKLIQQKRRQRGVTFPSARKQEHLLIIRLDLIPSVLNDKRLVRKGLLGLCGLLERIEIGSKKMERLDDEGNLVPSSLNDFAFTGTIGFGVTFFDKLNIRGRNRPRKLYEMPGHSELKDAVPYVLNQTDLIIQLGSGYQEVNQWVLKNSFDVSSYPSPYSHQLPNRYQSRLVSDDDSPDITTAIQGWARVTDKHIGFQRVDGRNLMGFNDGVSNPDRLSEGNNVWTKSTDEAPKFRDGTYMVFHKIFHNLKKWEELGTEKQEKWIGRSKGTGLLLGTLSKTEDYSLSLRLRSTLPSVSKTARNKLKRLLKSQTDPENEIYSKNDARSRRIQKMCPVWSHVRKANPRQENRTPKKIIFRRGYLYLENGEENSSGILFICFQRNIRNGFEYIKKEWLNNPNYPIPEIRRMHHDESRLLYDARNKIKGVPKNHESTLAEVKSPVNTDGIKTFTQTGREGLSGPTLLGSNPAGEYAATVSLGGGYYFVPPIPKKDFSLLAEPFFA